MEEITGIAMDAFRICMGQEPQNYTYDKAVDVCDPYFVCDVSRSIRDENQPVLELLKMEHWIKKTLNHLATRYNITEK